MIVDEQFNQIENAFHKVIMNRYNFKKSKNSMYSLRSFSRDLEVSSGRLCNFLSGRDIPGEKLLKHFEEKLSLLPEEVDSINDYVNKSKYLRRGHGFDKVLNKEELAKMSQIKTWSVHSYVNGLKGDRPLNVLELARKFKCSKDEMVSILETMTEIELIAKEGQDLYFPLNKKITTSNEIASLDVKKLHREFIQNGLQALEEVDLKKRDITGVTVRVDTKKIEEAKKLIQDFRAQLNLLLSTENDGDTTELYHCAVMLFPVEFK